MNRFNYRFAHTSHGPMVLAANDIIVNSVLSLYGEYSGVEVALLCSLLRPGDVVVDAGAHIGCITVPLAKTVGRAGCVIALEPQRSLFKALTANVALNDLANVRVLNMGASSNGGDRHIAQQDASFLTNYGGSHLEASGSGERVGTIPLDSLGLEKCRLIKIDVEGMELDVLKGATRLLAAGCAVYVENDPLSGPTGLQRSFELLQFLAGRGLELYWHAPPFVRDELLSDRPNVFAGGGSFNVLALPSAMAEQYAPLLATADVHRVRSADEIIFPLWMQAVTLRRVEYALAGSSGMVPLRDGDDPSRPWIVLYEAFLDHLSRRPRLGPVPFRATAYGWAFAEAWFEGLLPHDPAVTRVVAVGAPRALVALARELYEVIELKLADEVSCVGVPATTLARTVLLIGGDEYGGASLDQAARVAHRLALGPCSVVAFVGDNEHESNVDWAPRVWSAGPRAGLIQATLGGEMPGEGASERTPGV